MRLPKFARSLILVLSLSVTTRHLSQRPSDTPNTLAAMEASSRYVEVQGIRTRVLEVPGNSDASGEGARCSPAGRRRRPPPLQCAARQLAPTHPAVQPPWCCCTASPSRRPHGRRRACCRRWPSTACERWRSTCRVRRSDSGGIPSAAAAPATQTVQLAGPVAVFSTSA